MNFNTTKAEKIQITFYGGSLAANREIYDDTFDTTGDAIILEKSTINKYAVEISGNSYLEEDKSKKCRNYPNTEYASYKECDDQYMRNICDRVGLVPVWISKDFSEVTTKAVIDGTGYSIYSLHRIIFKLLQLMTFILLSDDIVLVDDGVGYSVGHWVINGL